MDSAAAALPALRVQHRKRNVFVTQLGEHREQKDDNIKLIPVITQGSSRLLETGVNTLQSTLVLRKRVEVDELSEQLRDKRQQVHGWMEILRERRAQLQHRQTETRLKAATFERFVEENEVKRRRALKKFLMERQQKELKEQEKAQLSTQLQELQHRRLCLKERVNKHKIFEEFLRKTLELLPDNYLGYRAEQVMAILRRFETLSLSREDLLQQLSSRAEQMKTGQSQLEALRQQHSTRKLMANQELSELQTQLDQTREKNKQLEMMLHMTLGQSREQAEELGNILIALRNLGEQCHLSHYGRLDSLDTPSVMDMIKEFMLDKADLERRATRLMDTSAAMVKKSPSGGVQLKSRSRATGMKTPQ